MILRLILCCCKDDRTEARCEYNLVAEPWPARVFAKLPAYEVICLERLFLCLGCKMLNELALRMIHRLVDAIAKQRDKMI
jgi:hypothetical protein